MKRPTPGPQRARLRPAFLLALPAALSVLAALPAIAGSEPRIRTYRTVNEQGETILHVTNLDEEGRRLGGELTPQERRRLEEATRSRPSGSVSAGDAGDPLRPTIIVNVFPPSMDEMDEEEPAPEETGVFEAGYARGLYPGFSTGGFFAGRHRHRSIFGRKRGHHGHTPRLQESEILPGRPRIIQTGPFTRGNAAARNRTAFRRN